MSAGSAKKKRIGSSRRVLNQNMTSEADEFHQLGNTTVVQHCIPEENTEPLNVSANPESSQFETQNPPPKTSRRKLGSSRRTKLQHVKNSAAESYPEPKDVEGKNTGYEAPKSTQLSLAMQPHRKEEYSKGTEQEMSATSNSSLYSAITPDYSLQVQSSIRTNCQTADLESLIPKSEHLLADQKEDDMDSEVIPNSCTFVATMLEEIDKSHILVSEKVNEKSHLVGISDSTALSVLLYPTVPEVTTDNSSPRENAELENNVEQEIFSTPNEKLPKDEEQSRHINFQDKDAQQREVAVNTVHERKAKAKEIHANNHSSGSVSNDAAGKHEITFGNLTDQPEVNVTYQSDLILKSAVDSASKQEDSNPCEQNVHPTRVSSSSAGEHANDDHDTHDTKNLQISATERVDTAPGQVHKTDGQVGDDLNPSVERAACLEKEVLFFETEESGSSMQSEIQACFNSHSEQTDTNLNPAGNRRELESSSRNKGRQHAEDFVAESYHGPTGAAVEDAVDNETLERKSLTIETAVWEKSAKTMLEGIDTFHIAQTGTLVDISSFNKSSVHLHSTVVNLSKSTEMPEELPNMYSVAEKESKGGDDTDLPRQGGNFQDDYLLSESHLKSKDKESSITLDTSIEKHGISEHTEPERNVEQAIFPLTEEGMPTSEGHSDTFNLSEIKGSYQLEDAVHIFDKQDIKVTEMTQMNEIYRTDFSSVKDDESSLKTLLSGTNASLDCQPQASHVRKEEQTQKGINPIERRRKTRHRVRRKGQLQKNESVSESHDENRDVLVNTRGNEVLKTRRVDGAVRSTSQETCQESELGIVMPTTHDSSLYSAVMPGYSSEVQNPTTKHDPADLKCSISKIENVQEDHSERDADFKVEASKMEILNKYDTFENQGVGGDQHSKDTINNVHEEEVKPTYEINCCSQSMACGAIANSEMISGNLLNQSEVSDTCQYEPLVERADDDPKEEALYPDDSRDMTEEENRFKALDHANEEDYVYDGNKLQIRSTEREDTAQGQECEGQVEDNIKPSAELTVHQEKEQFFSEMGESNSSSQSLPSEVQACLDFQPKQKDTDFKRKLGSSRRNKGRQCSKDFVAELYHRCEEEIVENTGDDEPLEAKIHLLTTETNVQTKSMETTLEQVDTFTTAQTAVSDQVKGIVHGCTLVGISKHSASSLHSSLEEIVNEEHEEACKPTQMQEMHQTDDPSVPTLQSESNAPMNRQPQENMRMEEQNHMGLNPIQNRRKLGSSRRNKGCLHIKESVTEPKEEFVENSSGDKADEFHQSGNTTVPIHCIPEENTEPLNVSANPESSQFETQNPPPKTSRRKLGSSRRTKLQHVKNSAAESYPEPKDVEEKNTGYEAPKSTQLSLAMQPHRKEEYSKGTEQQMSATSNSSLYSAITPDYSLQVQSSIRTNCQTADPESLIPKSEHLLADQKEDDMDSEVIPNSCTFVATMLEEIDKSHILVSEKVNEKSHLVGISDSTALSVLLYPTVPEVTTDNSSPRENAELENNVEQEIFSTPNEKLPKDEEQNRHINFQDKDAQQREVAVNTVHERRAKAKEIHANNLSSGSVSNDAAGKHEITFGNLTDQPEVNVTHQSDLILKSAVDSASKQEDSNPCEQNVHPTRVSSSSAGEHANDDHDTHDTKNLQISATERVDTAPGQVHKTDGQVGDDLNPSVERAACLEKEVLFFETEESGSSMQSEIQACFNSHSEQTDTNLNPAIQNRRKLGSSRRNKGCLHIKESVTEHKEKFMENSSGDEALETTKMCLEQEDANHVQTTEALSYGNNSPREVINVQQTNDAIETARDVANKGHSTESWRPMKGFRQDEEKCQDSSERDHEVIKASQEITHPELFSVVHNSKETSGQYRLEEDFRAEPAADVHEKGGISTTVHECNSQQRIQVKTRLHNTGKLQEESKQKRRKMGSTRWSQLNRKPETVISNKDERKASESNMQVDTKMVEQMVGVEELPLAVTAEVSLNPLCEGQQEANESSIVHNKGHRPQRSTSVLQSSSVLFPGQSASFNEEVVINPVTFDQEADVMDSERSVDVDVDQSLLNYFTGTEMLGGRESHFINPVQSSNTQDITSTAIKGGSFISLCETAQSTQNDEGCLQTENLLQDQAFKSAGPPAVDVNQLELVKSDIRGGEHQDAQAYKQELNNTSEGVLNINAEMKNASPNLNSANRRRKMGSTRRNLRSRNKGEYLDGDNKAADVTKNVGDVKFDSDSEQRKEKVFETVKHSHTAHDVMSETSPGRKIRKLGSHRRLHGHGRDVRGVIDGCSIKTTEEESLDQDKISKVDESDKESSLNITTSITGELSKPVREKAPVRVIPVQHPSAEMCQSQESKRTSSLVGSVEGAHRSHSYNVMIVGDSSVGKTSFMKRAQSGTFPLDLPPSVGLDFCMWTVDVDGKPVTLQLWDTAGQERYHSITRQMFHKAQAFLLMYDITSSRSFSAVSYWANCIQEGAAEDVNILILGNKCDHAERRIKTQEGEKLAKEYNFIFMECSAATGENVIESLETMAGMLSQKTDTKEEITALHKEPRQKKSTTCC